MQVIRLTLLLAVSSFAVAQSSEPAHTPWQMQESGTTASLRGIDSVDGTVAWASGTGGTVLRTIDGGTHWTACAIPDAATDGTTLDFRGVQAWDAETAIVMASGPGEKSRLYKTVDGGAHWSLLFTNPDHDGFWDAFVADVIDARSDGISKGGSLIISGAILGDPAVHKSNQWDTSKLPSFYLADFEAGVSGPNDKLFPSAPSIFAQPAEAIFAASNSTLKRLGLGTYWIATRTRLIQYNVGFTLPDHFVAESFCDIGFPVGSHLASAGAFSLAIRPGSVEPPKAVRLGGFQWKTPSCEKADMVVVGGDYQTVDDRQNTAAFTGGTNKFQLAKTPPHGYRSAVQWSETLKLWITVGTNGSDISRDDGKTWQPIDNGNWNALSLPFVVGPNGRIARMDVAAFASAK